MLAGMSKQKICPGSNHWAPAAPAVGKGLCSSCRKLIVRSANGILVPHKRISK
jgi:hypothetical protein